MKDRLVPPCPELVTPEASLGQRLKGKRILLTGTTKGVGPVAQELLCTHGAYVIGSGRTPGVAGANAQRLKDKGLKAEGFDVDLSNYEEAKAWVDKAAEIMGGIDIVINNASKPEFAPFEHFTAEMWDKSLANELDLVFNVNHAAWPHLIKAGGGCIINLSSVNGTRGTGNTPQAAHAAAKGAINALTKQLAAEGAPHGIRVNTLSPGLIATPGAGGAPGPMVKFLTEGQLNNHALDPMDIAYGILFLASDESRFITAHNLFVDGGISNADPGPNF